MARTVRQQSQHSKTPQQLRRELQHGATPELWRRHTIIGLSLVGMASMAAVTLFQTGLLSHLPDPPLPGFHSNTVNSSDTAYQFGVPDGPLSLAGHATTIALTAWGGPDPFKGRVFKQPEAFQEFLSVSY